MHSNASSVPTQERADASFAMSKILFYYENETVELDDQGAVLYGPLALLDWGRLLLILPSEAQLQPHSTPRVGRR